jgi:hypothetical protein
MYSTVQRCTVQFSNVEDSPAMYSTVQQCTVTVQQCTIQSSNVQYSSAMYNKRQQRHDKTTEKFKISDIVK